MTRDIEIRESQVALFYRKIDTQQLPAKKIASVTRARFLDPIEGMADANQSRVLVLPADSGNGQLVIAEETTTLQMRHFAAAAKDPDRAMRSLIERVQYQFGVVDALKEKFDLELTYSGAVVRAAIRSESMNDEQLATVLAEHYGLRESTGIEDLNITLTQTITRREHVVIRAQCYRRFELGPIAASQTRLHPDEAVERGIEVAIDYNSRRGYNLGETPNETLTSVSEMVKKAFQQTSDSSQELAEKVS